MKPCEEVATNPSVTPPFFFFFFFHKKLPIIIARNRGHFAPVINCQQNLIFKMADKSYRNQGKRIPYDILNNLSSVDLLYEEKGKNKTS